MPDPVATVIIPCGPRHAHLLPDALRSVQQQSVPCVATVINDTGAPLDVPDGVTVLPGSGNVARNRNAGLAQADTPFVLFLDADDYLLPSALIHLLHGQRASSGYTYGDAYLRLADGTMHYAAAPRWSQTDMARRNLHTVSALVPTACAREVGGFDTAINAWEDWTLWLRLAMAGVCGHHITQPIIAYRVTEGERREMSLAGGWDAMTTIQERYATNGRIEFMACGCSSTANGVAHSVDLPTLQGATLGAETIMEYTGDERGSVSYTAPSGRQYKLGNNALHRQVAVAPADAVWMAELGIAKPAAAVAPPSEPPTASAVLSAPEGTEAVKPGKTTEAVKPSAKKAAT